MIRMLRLFLLVLLALVCGCMKSVPPMSADLWSSGSTGGAYESPSPAYEVEAADDFAPAARARSASAPSEPSEASPATEPSAAPSSTTAPSTAPERMVHYNGYVALRADRPEEVVATVSAQAVTAGGFVEQQAGTHVTVRVPVAAFEATFASVLKLGEVLRKSVAAEDVTEAYAAIDLRLAVSTATRDRLMVLLAQAKTESDKLAILAQLQRVEEEIDQLGAQVRLLAGLAAFSRISVDVDPRRHDTTLPADEDLAGMGWIRWLSPFTRTLESSGRRVVLPLPEGIVPVTLKGPFSAETADGVVLRTSRIRNEPKGDAAFWVDALDARLTAGFGGTAPVVLGPYRGLSFSDLDPAGYRYDVAVRVDGAWLEVLEVFYPSPAQVERYSSAIQAAVGGGNG